MMIMPRRRKLIRPGSSPVTSAVVARLSVLGLNPVIATDARPGDRINCRALGNAREGDAVPLVSVGYVRALPDGVVRLAGLRSAHQINVSIALQAAKIPHRI